MKMKIWALLLTVTTLSIGIYVFSAGRILNPSVQHLNVRENPPKRQSVILQDELSTYNLNISQYLREFPYLQNYNCSPIHLPPPSGSAEESMAPLLVLAIKSHPKSSERRSAIRQTWASVVATEGYRVRCVFLMGRSQYMGNMDMVRRESLEYKDILQWDFMEGHHNLSLKDRCFLEWLHFNVFNVDFVLKGDDDEFVNPTALVRYIKEHGTPYVLHGALQRHASVQRHGKYQVSGSLFPYGRYPYFLSGGGFLFPGPSIRYLYRVSQILPVFPLDDVYFGFLVLAANLTFRHDDRFHVWGLSFSTCAFKQALVVHSVEPKALVNMWTQLQKAVCENEKSTKGYENV